jgi:hypothetical protein
VPFIIYPDVATATLLGKPISTPVHLADSETMSAFVPLASLVGPDPSEGNVPTTFIRVSMSGPPAPTDKQPKIELLAHDPNKPGGPARPIDPNTAITVVSGIGLRDDVNTADAALAYFSPPFLHNVYLLKVVIEIPGTKLWIKITNTTGTDRNFVWVVADNDADTRQPWVHATYRDAVPADIKFNAFVGQTSAETAQPIEISNRGTGAVTVSDVTPAIAAPYTISGLPVTLGPNPSTPATVTVGFNAPSTPGDIPAAAFGFITSDKTDPGPFGAGHNDQFILSAHTHTRLPPPSFAPSPHQFDPKRGQPGLKAVLFGTNFDLRPVSVSFGTVAAPIFGVSSSELLVNVPPMPPGPVNITVMTSTGSVTSDDDFTVLPEAAPAFAPSPNQFGPKFGSVGSGVTLSGSNFFTVVGETVSVRFGNSPTNIVGMPTPSQIVAAVPDLPAGECRITVEQGGGGSVTSDDLFTIVPEGTVPVPNVIGMFRDQAEQSITSLGLTVQTEFDGSAEHHPMGTVESQEPLPGTPLRPNDPSSIVTIHINSPL